MKRRRLIFLCFLVTSLCLSPVSASSYESFAHPDTCFSDMVYTGIDADAVDTFCEQFAHEPVTLYPELLALYDEIYTQEQLAFIRMCQNANDTDAAAESERAANNSVYARDRICLALSEALLSPQGNALAALMPEGEAEAFADYAALSDDEISSAGQETALVSQYYLLPDDESFADAAGELYLRLAALRRTEAERAGFDSYPEYAYYVNFAREYAPEDMEPLRRMVKTTIAPLYTRCVAALYSAPPLRDDEIIPPDEQIMGAIAAHIGEISPELTESMDFLLRNRLYFLSSGDELLDTGYTAFLPAYRSAFIFDHASSRFYAFKDAVHEFGHFNAAYHDPTPMLYQFDSIDVAEIQSQGMELLFLPYLQDIVARSEQERDTVKLQLLSDILGSVVDGCLYDEFEQAVYADPDMSVAQLHKLEKRLLREYSLDALYGNEPGWCYVTHLFDNPCYYISYAVSAIPALDIWLRSLNDRGAAVDAYMSVSAARTDAWFFDVLADNDLCDPTDARDMVRLARALEQELESLSGKSSAPMQMTCFAAGVMLIVILLFILRRKKSAERKPLSTDDDSVAIE